MPSPAWLASVDDLNNCLCDVIGLLTDLDIKEIFGLPGNDSSWALEVSGHTRPGGSIF